MVHSARIMTQVRSTLLAMFAACCAQATHAGDSAPSFRDEVLPILSDHCFECHGFDPGSRSPKDEPLRLDLFASATATRSHGGKAAIPGNPSSSLLIQRVRSDDPELVMPPPKSHKPLNKEQIRILERWIASGAEYQRHWAFEAPARNIPLPETTARAWPRNPIDPFVLARLEKEGLTPSKPAPPERWLRRVTYDLTGLPPTREEIDAFLAEPSPSAREVVVDRLLASPRFGERMATPWLDVARYADSFGYQADIATEAWPYRDWVIRSFNSNLPFDKFIIEQLAGDLLENPTRDQRLATTFNRIHRKTNEGGSVPEEFRQDGISDRVHTVGTAFMALTFECARCHDHKYDPISMKDYYSLGAFFNSIDEFGLIQGGKDRGMVLPQPALQLPTPEQEKTLVTLQLAVTEAEARLRQHLTQPADAATNAAGHPSPDLAARFRFDETTGDKLCNEVNEKEPAKTGGNRLAPGKFGNAILADGDSLTTLPSLGIEHADQPFSFSFWLKPAEAHERAVVFANTSSFDVPFSGYELLLEKGHLTWTLAREQPGCAASVTTVTTIPVGEWTHITVTNDGSRRATVLRIFLNGKRSDTTIVFDNLTRDFNIGNALHFMGRGRDIGMKGGMVDEIQIHRRAISELEVASIFTGQAIAQIDTTPEQRMEYYRSAVDPISRQLTDALSAARAAYRDEESKIREILTMRESKSPVPAYILARGDYTSPTEKVERETPYWLPPFPADAPRNRLGFARWLTSPHHPLTARVTVNRIWQDIFGKGIVTTSENFGIQGARPSHPDLLDWLARDFIASGWDMKRAIRQMVLSATYAQDSGASPALRERDPDNALLARGPSRRLTAEQLRDSALALSGLLSGTIGGPPAKPYQAPGSMWKTLNNFLPEYQPDKGEGLYRRSLYTFWRRTTTPPNMMVFDSATRDVCATRRQVTNTPLQALVLLNDPQFVEAARKLGERILKLGGNSDEERARWACLEVTGRTPTSEKLDILMELIREQRGLFQAKPSDAEALLRTGESPADPALDKAESATFAILAQALLNLDAHITLR